MHLVEYIYFNQMHSRPSKGAVCTIRRTSVMPCKLLPRPKVLVSDIPGAGWMPNGVGS